MWKGMMIVFQIPIYNQNIIEEINYLKRKILELEEKIKLLETNKNNNYLKKDDSYYMI